MEVVASLSQGRKAAAQCGLFTHKSVPVIFEPPCSVHISRRHMLHHVIVSSYYSSFPSLNTGLSSSFSKTFIASSSLTEVGDQDAHPLHSTDNLTKVDLC